MNINKLSALVVTAFMAVFLCVSAQASLRFNGVDSYVHFAQPFFNGASLSQCTLEFAFKADDSALHTQTLWGKSGHGTEYSVGILDGKLVSGGGNTPGWIEAFAFPVTNATWTYFALVKDASASTVTFYVNGVQKGQVTDTTGPINWSQQVAGLSTGYNTLGRFDGYTSGIPNNYFLGNIAEFRTWSWALSGAEIKARIGRQLTPSNEVGLSGYWRIDEMSGTVVNDLVGNNNGILYGGATWSSDLPTLVPPVPHRATGTAQVVNGFVVGVSVTDPGYGYTVTVRRSRLTLGGAGLAGWRGETSIHSIRHGPATPHGQRES